MNSNPSSALVSGLQLFNTPPDATTGKTPLVYGRNVYIPNASVISHKIGVSGDRKRLIHYFICLISVGQLAGYETGEVVELVPGVYSHGIRVGRSIADTNAPIFLDWRQGFSSQEHYADFPTRSYAYKIRTREATMPTSFSNGVPITNCNIYWQSTDGLWNGATISPGDSIGISGWSEWITLNTPESTAYNSFCTAYVEQQSMDGEISPVDFMVAKGRSVKRIGYSEGAINIDKGDSDRFPDVVYDLVNQTTLRSDYLVDLESFYRANQHVASEGLLFGGAISGFDSLYNFVNQSSIFFDLIPSVSDNRMGFIANRVESAVPVRLFTNTNHSDFSYEYLDSYLHRVSEITELVTDSLSGDFRGILTAKSSTTSDAGTPVKSTAGSIAISAEQLMSDRASLSRQAERIKASINSQDEQIVFTTDSIANTIEPGDFILAYDTSFAVGRVYVGGISRKAEVDNIPNLFYTVQPSFAFPLTLDRDITDNTLSLTNQFRLELAVGDFIVFNITKQNSTGASENSSRVVAKVVGVTAEAIEDNQQQIKIQIAKQKWVESIGRWVFDTDKIIIPSRTEAVIYRLALTTDYAIVDDYKGLYKARAELMLVPIADKLESCIRFKDYSPTITQPVPVLLAPDTELAIWRVASIEVQPSKDSNILYKVCATIYEGFGSKLSLEERRDEGTINTVDQTIVAKQEAQVKPVVTKRDIDYPAYTFGVLEEKIIDTTKLIPNLDPVNLGGFTARAAGTTGVYPIAATGANETNSTDRPVMTQGAITSRYQDAVVKIEMRDGQHGTGFIVSSDGTLLTNNHVGSIASRAILRDNSVLQVKWYKLDVGNDIAIGKLLDSREFVYCELAAVSGLKTGDRVYAIGNSIPNFFATTTSTIESYGVKCTPNETTNCYQAADGLLEGGGSGSPIFNNKGLVVGMARAIALTSEGEKDYFMEVSPVINRIYNERLWVPPVGRYTIPMPVHTARSGYARMDLENLFKSSAISLKATARIYRDSPDKIAKWPIKIIKLSVAGIYSVVDKRNFKAYSDEINSMLPSGMGIEISFLETGTQSITTADVYAFVVPKEQFNIVTTTYKLSYPSYSYVNTDGASKILSGYILVPFDQITDTRRARLFARELLRILGLVGDSTGSSNSVLTDSALAQEPTSSTLAVIDEQAIKLLYRPEFTYGMAVDVASRKLSKIQEI